MPSDPTLRRILRSDRFVGLAGDLTRALVAAAVALVVTLCLAYYAYLARRMFGELRMNDFGRFYYSAKAFLDGQDMYGPTTATAIGVGSETFHLWNMNPPHFHFLILPLALLSPLPAAVLWLAINILCLGISVGLIARELNVRWSVARIAWTSTAVILCSATGMLVVTGQVTFVLMLPMTLAWIEARAGRWPRSAIWLGILASIKPFLGLFWIYLVLARRIRAAGVMALAALACTAVGLSVFGWTSYVGWLGALTAVDWGFAPMNASIHGVLRRIFSENPIFFPLAKAPWLVLPAAATLGIGLGAVSLRLLARRRRVEQTDLVFSGLILTSLLISPLGWMYYFWLAAGPLAAVGTVRASEPGAARSAARDVCLVVATPGLILPLYVTTAWADSGWGALTLGSLYAWTILALWGAVILEASRGDRATSRV